MFEDGMSAWDNFPAFESVFGKQDPVPVPLYLTLLGPSPDATRAVEEIATCIRRSGENFTFELSGLLGQRDWRPHLVAAVALLINGASDEQLGLLWNAIKQPSWVSPQLVASASQLDAKFSERAREMIQARCVFDDAALPRMNWPERHSALGPSSYDQHRAKLISSLISLCETRQDAPGIADLKNQPDIAAMVSSDIDKGGQIAVQWIAQVAPLVRQISSRS